MSDRRNYMSVLADGIQHALKAQYRNKPFEFLLVLAVSENDEVVLHSVTGITDPNKLRTIARHLSDMADQQPTLDPDSDNDVQGHA